jgi:hypothetical protein
MAGDKCCDVFPAGAYFMVKMEFNGGGGGITKRDLRLTDKQVVGVRAFACLLGLTVEQLRARCRLTLAQERALDLEVVLTDAAGRVKRERGLADDKLVAGFVLMDEINSAVMQYRQLIGVRWG